jgi:hypothetical protein
VPGNDQIPISDLYIMGTSKISFHNQFAIQPQKMSGEAHAKLKSMCLSGADAPNLQAFPTKGYSYPTATSFRLKIE